MSNSAFAQPTGQTSFVLNPYRQACYGWTGTLPGLAASPGEVLVFRDRALRPGCFLESLGQSEEQILDHDVLFTLTVPLYSELQSCGEENDFHLDRKEGLLADPGLLFEILK